MALVLLLQTDLKTEQYLLQFIDDMILSFKAVIPKGSNIDPPEGLQGVYVGGKKIGGCMRWKSGVHSPGRFKVKPD